MLLAFVLVAAFCYIPVRPVFASSVEDSWTQMEPMSQARAYLGVAVVNGKIYAIGGDNGQETASCSTGRAMTNNEVNCTEEYNPKTDTWTMKTDMPTARARFGTAVYDDRIYCVGGYNGANVFVGPEDWNWKTEYYDVAANEIYDTVTDTWQTANPLPTPRYAAATNIVNGKIYVIGGHTMRDLYAALRITEVYNTETDSWTTKASAPLPVPSSASAVIDNKIYVLGQNDSGHFALQIYDPATNDWEIGGNAPVGYSSTATATTGMNAPKRIYFFDENRTDIYDPVAKSWMTGAKAPTDRLIASAANVDDTIYLIGGRTGQWGVITFMYPSNLNEKYTPIGYGTFNLPSATSTPSPSPTYQPTSNPIDSETTPSTSESKSTPEPSSPTIPLDSYALVVAVSVVVTVSIIGLLVYFKKNKKH